MKHKQRETMNLTKLSDLNDRQIDALVAERVFDWEWWERSFNKCSSRRCLFPPERDGWIRLNFSVDYWSRGQPSTKRFSDWDECCRNDQTGARGLPRYSTLINAAMQIVEKVREQGFGVTLKTKQSFWRVEIYPEPDNGHDGLNVENDSLPRAICEAALTAVESGVK